MPGILRKTYLLLFLLTCSLYAQPKKAEVVAGKADFQTHGKSVEIKVSDKTIINYQKFDINKNETVRFIQPSQKSTLLNRVIGKDPSKILGNLHANGRVFLVNPSGIYFGKGAVVHTASFLASSLDIKDDDFLQDRLQFHHTGDRKGAIINEGMIASNPEGFVALFAPVIQNRGSIIAKAGKVCLAAAEHVTVDFSGDGLVQFSVDGKMKEAVIENYGKIEAADGHVELLMRSANDLIKMVVNTDGITPVNDIEEKDGVIRLVSNSNIKAKNVDIDGGKRSSVTISGKIDASDYDKEHFGGNVTITGKELHLQKSHIDVSGDIGGGTLLIGGDYQGKGTLNTACNMTMESTSTIFADAQTKGDGGKVILWSDDTTIFNGKIFARGGKKSGNGGFVETSGTYDLGIETGFVDTSATYGSYGDWLLDPNTITIAIGGNANLNQVTPPRCATGGNRTIAPATIEGANSNISLCAQSNATSSITVTDPVSMNNDNIALSLTAGSTNTGTINLNNNLTTRAGVLSLVGEVVLGNNVILDTTGGGATPAGNNVSFSTIINGTNTLTITGGSGTVTMTGVVGGATPLAALDITSSSINQNSTVTTTGSINYAGSTTVNGNITTSGGTLDTSGSVTVTGNRMFDTTNGGGTPAGANITFSSTLNGGVDLTLNAGTGGNVSFNGAVGGTTPPANLVFTSANTIQIGNNITVSGANPLTFPFPVSLTGTSTVTSNNANINFNNTLNGAQSLNLVGGTGTITFSTAIGATTPIQSLTASAATINQNVTADVVAGLSYTGTSAINIPDDITSQGGNISMIGAVNISTTPTFDTTNGGSIPSGGNISFSNTVNGATSLVLTGGVGGNVTLSGAVGNTTPLTTLTATGLSITQGSSVKTTGAVSYTATSSINVGGNITTSGNTIGITGPMTIASNPTLDTTNAGATPTGANITFSNTINGTSALTLRAGSVGDVIFNGAIGEVNALTNLSFVSTNLIQLGSNIVVTGANPLVFPFPVQLNGVSNITSNNGNVTFNDTVNSNVAFSHTLRLTSGSGNAAFNAAVGGTTQIGTLAISSANNVTANAITVGALSQSAGSGTTTFNGAVSTSNVLGINLTGTAFAFNDTVTTTSSGGISIANSGLLSMPNGSNFTVDGAFLQTGSGAVQSGNVITSNDNITFTGAVALTSAASYSTAATSQVITFLSSIDSVGATPFDLTLDAGTSNISIQGDMGSIHPLGAFLVNSTNNLTIAGLIANSATLNGGSGTTTVNGDVQIGSGGISITGNNFISNGNVLTTDGGSVTINNSGSATRGSAGATITVDGDYSVIGTGPAFGGATLTVNGDVLINPTLTLVNNTVIDTSGGNGNITFNSTVNGTRNLTLSAGSGDITFGGNVGTGVTIGNITINSANNVDVQQLVAASFRQLAGTGTTTFNGAVTTSGALGVAITSNIITRGAAITTTGGGPLSITNSGTFTSTAAGNISLDGAFTQNGAGNVSFGGNMTTSNDNISFVSPVSMAANSSFNTGIGAGNITFSQGAQGAFNLTLNSGTGNITLGGNVGTVGTPVTAFTITRAADVSTQDIFSSFITQSAGSGTTTFNGTLNTSSLTQGISLTGTSFTLNDAFTTSGTAPVSITHTGVVTFSSGATGTIAGALTQTGSGSVVLSSTITAGDAMEFSGPCSVSGTGSLSTQAVNQPITFFSTLEGPGNLTLSTGTEDILISGDAGASTALGDLVISTARNLTTQAISASSITQSAGTGTSLFQGDVTTSAVGGIDLTGATFTFLEDATANNSGTITIANSGLLTTSAGKTLSAAGGFSQTGSGNVSLGSNISATNNDITFNSAITLTSDVLLNSGTTAGDITLDTVDGNHDLTFTAGQDITAGAIGGTTRLGAVTATTVRNINASSITAGAIIQQAGSGTTALTGNINTNTPTGINLTGTNFSRSGSIITTNGGSFVVSNSGSISGTSINTTSIDGSYTQIAVGGSSSFSLAGTITARQGISLSSPITLLSDPSNLTPVILDSSGGNGNISVTGAIDNDAMAAHTLTFRSGAGNVTISADIGATTAIGPLLFGDVNNVTTAAVTAESIAQESMTSITGLVTCNGTLTTSGSSGIVLSGNSFTFNDVTTTGTGPFDITNSGSFTISDGTTFSLDGAFTQTGTGSVDCGGSITTTDDAISFASFVTLTNPVSLNSGSGGGNITLSGAINGANTLSLTAGTGDIALQSAIGQTTAPTALTVVSANNIQMDSNALFSGPFTVTSATGTTTFSGTLQATAIDITGAVINFNDAVTTTSAALDIANSGTLTIASMSPLTSATNCTQTGAGSVSLGSNITTTGTLSIASSTTLTNDISLNSQGGDLTLSDTVDGNFDLTMASGSGDIAILGIIGGTTRIGDFTITSAQNVDVEAITASSIALLNSTGTATLNGSLDTNSLGGITLAGNAFTSSGTITTANGGPFIITNSGLVTATGASTVTLNGGGAFLQNGTGAINLGGTLTTQNANITFAGPANVLLPISITSNNGNITFQNTIDGPDCPTLDAGTGDITFDGIMGATTPLGCMDATGATIFQNQNLTTSGTVSMTASNIINMGGDITSGNSDITLTGNVITTTSVTLSSDIGVGNISVSGSINGDIAGRDFTISSGTGDITLSGALNGNNPFNDITLTANNISVAQLGSTVVGSSGVTTMNATTDLNFTGTTYNSGEQIYTAGNNFNFSALSAISLSSNFQPVTFNTGTIQASSNLNISTFGGNLTFTTLLGTGIDLVANADIGDFTFTQIGASGDNLNDVTLTSNNFSPAPSLGSNVFANSLTINSSTPQVISSNQTVGTVTFNAPVAIQGNITYSCGSTGTITFNQRLDADTAGVDTLIFDFDPCNGSVVFNGPVGAVAPLASLSIDASNDVTVNNTINVGSFDVTNGVGTTSINSGMTATAAGGIDIVSPTINLSGSFTTANSGGITLNNSSGLTISAGSSIDSVGAFQQTGAGSASIGGTIITHDAAVAFTGDVSLNSATSLRSEDVTGGDISFAGTLGGTQNLTLRPGSGNISFSGVVGGLTPLSSLTITNANNVTASATISATSIRQSAGTGTTTFDALTTTGLNGINLTGSAFTLSGNITTSNSGPVIINNSGNLIFSNATHSIAGALTQSGSGSSTLVGSFTVGGAVSFAEAVTLSGTTSFDTSANGQNISSSSTITNDGGLAHDLTFTAGSGKITCSGNIGATPIGALTVSSAGDATFGVISAGSITQSAGTGTTTISGNMTTTAVGGVDLTGTNFTINSTVTTTNSGPFNISHTGLLSLTSGSSTQIAGAFAESGVGGIVSLSGTVATSDQNLSFANGVTLAGNSTLSTGSGAGTLTLSSSVNGNSNFTLEAGTGNISFGGNLGTTTPLNAFTVNSVNNITYPQVSAASIVQSATTGTTTITGPFNTTGSLGVSITGGAINQNGAINTLNEGPVSFTNTGTLTIANGINTSASGAYSQSGGGSVSLGGSVTAINDPISIAGAVALTADLSITSGPVTDNGNDISFSGAVTGAQALTVSSDGGSIVFNADVGTAVTPLTSFTITKADIVTTQAVYAGSITQLTGTGESTFNGTLETTTGDISLAGSAFTFNDTISSSGALTLNNSGLATFNAGATGSITGAFTQNGIGDLLLSSAVTAGGAVNIHGDFSTSGTASIDTSAANQPITFFSSVDGPGDLTLASGIEDITLQANAGESTRLGDLIISSVADVTTKNITATSIQQSAGSGTSLFDGDLNTNGSGGISITCSQCTFIEDITTTGGGPVTLTNSGTLTTSIGKTITSNGTFTQNGTGNLSLASSITTTNTTAANAGITFSGSSPITLIAPVTFNSSTGGGDIDFAAASTVNGNQAITLNAGSGDINILGDFGGVTRVGAFTITNANDVQVQAVTSASFTQLAGTGTSSLLGALNTNTPTGMSFTGNNFTTGALATSITTTNGGSLTFNNQGVISGNAPVAITIDGSFIQTGTGPIFVQDTTARQGFSFSGPVIVAINTTLNSSGGDGDLTFSNIVSGSAGTEDLMLTAGAGNITFAQAIGLTTTVGAFNVTELGSLTASGETISVGNIGSSGNTGVAGTTDLTASGELIFTGTTYNANAQNYSASQQYCMEAGALTTFTSNGNAITFQTADIVLGTDTDLTMITGGIDLTLPTIHAQDNDLRTLVVNTGAGSIDLANLGTSGDRGFASATFTSNNLTLGDVFADSFTFNYSGTLNAGGDIISTDTALAFANPVVLQASNTFSTVGTTGNDITFSSTVNGASNDTFGLTLNAGAGDITLSQNVGNTGRLLNLVFGSAQNVVTQAPLITAALIQQNGSGTTTFNGSITVPGVLGISLTGNNFTINDSVQTLNNAPLTVTNSGTLAFAGTANLSGAFTQASSSGPVTLSGSITANQPISFAGPVTFSGSPSLDTSGGNQTITCNNTIGGNGDITFASGSGDIFLQANTGSSGSHIGAVTINSCHNITAQSVFSQSLNLVSSTGLARVNGTLSTNGAAGINLVGQNFLLNGALITTNGGSVVVTNSGLITGLAASSRVVDNAYTQNGTGPVNFAGSLTTLNGPISFDSTVTCLGVSSFDSSASDQNITFASDIEGPSSLTLDAGGGNVTISGLVGGNQALTNFRINSSANVNINGVGTTAKGAALINLQASNDITLTNNFYTATRQTYSATSDINVNVGSQTNFTSFSDAITIPSGTIQLSSNSDLVVLTNDGDFSFTGIVGGTPESIIIDAGTGSVTLGDISSTTTISDLIVKAGEIFFDGPIGAGNISFTSLAGISNTTGSVLIQTPNTIFFNGLGGDVGSESSPILVQSGGQIFAGAGGSLGSLAVFNGSSSDNTINVIPSNPPCKIIFNGVVIKDCGFVPPSSLLFGGFTFPFAVPGFDSSWFNLASDYFFLSYFLDKRFFQRDNLMFYRSD